MECLTVAGKKNNSVFAWGIFQKSQGSLMPQFILTIRASEGAQETEV